MPLVHQVISQLFRLGQASLPFVLPPLSELA